MRQKHDTPSMDFCQSQKAILCILLLLAGALAPASADSARVTLAWDPSPSPLIAGYRLYEGAGSGAYTNVLDVGAATTVTVSNLVAGTTYFFAVSAYDFVGLESALSAEVTYTVRPPEVPRLVLALNARHEAVVTGSGPAGSTYDLLVTADLQRWTALTNLTIGPNGTCQYIDVSADTTATEKRYYRLQRRSP